MAKIFFVTIFAIIVMFGLVVTRLQTNRLTRIDHQHCEHILTLRDITERALRAAIVRAESSLPPRDPSRIRAIDELRAEIDALNDIHCQDGAK